MRRVFYLLIVIFLISNVTAISWSGGITTGANNLSQLGDVDSADVLAASDGDVLTWSTAAQLWIASIGAGLGDFSFSDFQNSFDANFSDQTTDDLPQGTTNLYNNNSFNESLTDGKYVPYEGATANVNLSIYNLTTNQINLTSDFGSMKVDGRGYFIASDGETGFLSDDEQRWIAFDVSGDVYGDNVITCWNGTDGICRFIDHISTDYNLTVRGNYISNGTDWFSFQDLNATGGGGSGDNASWNQTRADELYANISWNYNQTVPANEYTDLTNTTMTTWIEAVFLKITDMFTKQEINDMVEGNYSALTSSAEANKTLTDQNLSNLNSNKQERADQDLNTTNAVTFNNLTINDNVLIKGNLTVIGNVSIQNVTEVNVNITNSIELNGTILFDWRGLDVFFWLASTINSAISGNYSSLTGSSESNYSDIQDSFLANDSDIVGTIEANITQVNININNSIIGNKTQHKNATGTYLFNDTDSILFNDTRLNETINQKIASELFFPTSFFVEDGTFDEGNLTSFVFIRDSGVNATFNVSEDAGASPLTLIINYTNVSSMDFILFRWNYIGGAGHEIFIGLWDWNDNIYVEEFGDITDTMGFVSGSISIFDPENHVADDGNVSLRFRHEQNGLPTHDFVIDYLPLLKGTSTITSSEHDSLQSRDFDSNHPQYTLTSGNRNMTNLSVTDTILTQNLTATDWLFGKLNFSFIQDVPDFFLGSVIVQMINGNFSSLTNSAEANYSNIQDSFLANDSNIVGTIEANKTLTDQNLSILHSTKQEKFNQSLNTTDDVEFRNLTVQNLTVTGTSFLNDIIFNGDIDLDGNDIIEVGQLNATEICISDDCRTEWPSGGGAGNPFDQELNITSNVTFDNVDITTINNEMNTTAITAVGSTYWLWAKLDTSSLANYWLSTIIRDAINGNISALTSQTEANYTQINIDIDSTVSQNITDLNDTVVHLTTDETIDGIKTFSEFPFKSGDTTPSNNGDLATKQYVDTVAAGLSVRESVQVATILNNTLDGEQTIDGIPVVSGQRILVKNQTEPRWNGIYNVNLGEWIRSTDFDENETEIVEGAFTTVIQGTINANTQWVMITMDPLIVNTTDINWTLLSASSGQTGGDGIDITANVISVDLKPDTGLVIDTSQLAFLFNSTDFSIIAGALTLARNIISTLIRADQSLINTGDEINQIWQVNETWVIEIAGSAEVEGNVVNFTHEVFEAYNNAEIMLTTSAQEVPLGVEKFTSPFYTHDTVTNNGQVTINVAGRYRVSTNVAFYVMGSGGQRGAPEINLEKNTGLGFIAIAGQATRGYSRRSLQDSGESGSLETFEDFDVGDIIRTTAFDAVPSGTDVNILSGGASMKIEYFNVSGTAGQILNQNIFNGTGINITNATDFINTALGLNFTGSGVTVINNSDNILEINIEGGGGEINGTNINVTSIWSVRNITTPEGIELVGQAPIQPQGGGSRFFFDSNGNPTIQFV